MCGGQRTDIRMGLWRGIKSAYLKKKKKKINANKRGENDNKSTCYLKVVFTFLFMFSPKCWIFGSFTAGMLEASHCSSWSPLASASIKNTAGLFCFTSASNFGLC